MPCFDDIEAILRPHFYDIDMQVMRISLGAMAAHYLPCGDPSWLFIIGPPGSGKTSALIMGAASLPQVEMISDVTENTFLSGFHGHSQPGLLERLGQPEMNGHAQVTRGDVILLVKDFTSVLSMRREKRATILSQLREIHDGQFSRRFGTGAVKVWEGKATVIAAVTPSIDLYYSIFTSLGERFLQVRLNRPTSAAGAFAIRQQGHELQVRKQLSSAINTMFSEMKRRQKELPLISDEALKRLTAMAEFAAIGRTHIHRSGYGSREIEYVPAPEANTRIGKELAAIARGIAALKGLRQVGRSELDDVERVALDCIPQLRRSLLRAARQRNNSAMEAAGPRTVRKRALEDLSELGLLNGRDESYVLSDLTASLITQGVHDL